jgi:hypothetical protein
MSIVLPFRQFSEGGRICQLSDINCQLTFVPAFVCNGEFFAAFSAACCKYAAAVGCSHSLKEAVLVAAFAL